MDQFFASKLYNFNQKQVLLEKLAKNLEIILVYIDAEAVKALPVTASVCKAEIFMRRLTTQDEVFH